jgi:hypothetical protein
MGEPRPLYHRFAWAYDLLVNEPIDARIAAMVSLLGKRGVRPRDEVVDAGCGLVTSILTCLRPVDELDPPGVILENRPSSSDATPLEVSFDRGARADVYFLVVKLGLCFCQSKWVRTAGHSAAIML